MPPNSSLYRFRIEVSDVDRGFYGELDFRAAMHPSEGIPYFVTRILAYALNYEEGLVFSGGGLSDPDEPCISASDPRGGYSLWIEIGNASARRIHKAAKAAKRAKVYIYKNPEAFLGELAGEKLHRAEELEIYSLAPEFLEEIGKTLERDNSWNLVASDGSLIVNIGDESFTDEILRHYLST